MRISLIAALGKNRVIGNEGQLPWRLPDDLRRFRKLTIGRPVVMGRKTFESIGHPLEGRRNIVLTTRPDYIASGCAVVHSVSEALAAAVGNEEVLIIGGGLVYEQFLPIADRLYLTLIESAFDGDSYFPTLDEDKWREVARETHEADGDHPWPFNFVVLERIRDEP